MPEGEPRGEPSALDLLTPVFLMKRSARDAFSTRTVIDDSVMEITTLGAGSEVGRSCILLKYKGKTIMLDCGVHPAYSGENSLPLYQNIDVKSVDLLLVTQYVRELLLRSSPSFAIHFPLHTLSLLLSSPHSSFSLTPSPPFSPFHPYQLPSGSFRSASKLSGEDELRGRRVYDPSD